jgi:hypothetical protein
MSPQSSKRTAPPEVTGDTAARWGELPASKPRENPRSWWNAPMSERAVLQRWGPQRATSDLAPSDEITPATHPE